MQIDTFFDIFCQNCRSRMIDFRIDQQGETMFSGRFKSNKAQKKNRISTANTNPSYDHVICKKMVFTKKKFLNKPII
jgi:hypothetical protein